MTNIDFKKDEVKVKLNKIKYRGPDNLGIQKEGNVILGHLRLAIIDLDERSNQPYNFDKYTVVYNGEIYNFNDVKSELISLGYKFNTTSDTEVLIKAFDAWGETFVTKLNGMFSFVIYNKIENCLFAARDRLGVKPFYYYYEDGKIEICSQIGPLINSESRLSNEAIAMYLDCGYVPSPYSIIENIKKLEPGNTFTLNLNTNEMRYNKYWDLNNVKLSKLSYNEAKSNLHELIKDSVKIRMNSDVSFGSFLSGGVDSALVSSIASSISGEKLKTYTIGFNESKYDESKVAKNFSQIIGSDHTEIKCTTNDVKQLIPKLSEVFDEPFADNSAIPSLLLNKKVRKNVTVALSGDGGDESFFGYAHFDVLSNFNKISFMPLAIRRLISKIPWHKITGTRPETITEILESKDAYQLAVKIFTGFSSILRNRDLNWLNYYKAYKQKSNSTYQQMADLSIKLWLENDSNVKVDRASMAYSVEVRSPFLDYRVIEFARSLPVSYRYNKSVKKKILRDILSEYIPEEVFNVPKRGFSIPLSDWIKGELKSEIQEKLDDDFFRKLPMINKELFVRQFKSHMKGKSNYSTNIWRLYILSCWMRKNNFI